MQCWYVTSYDAEVPTCLLFTSLAEQRLRPNTIQMAEGQGTHVYSVTQEDVTGQEVTWGDTESF